MAQAAVIPRRKRAPIKPLPPRAELHRLFIYEPDTGILRWRIRPHPNALRIHPGQPVRTVSECGYLVVGIGRVYYLVHRIIWKMMLGVDPSDQIDHRDTDRLNNRWDNLRPADNGSNRWNSRLAKNNTSGVKGVCYDAGRRKWVAYIGVGKTYIRLGRFKSFNDACAVRAAAADKLHGSFSRAE